MEIRKTLKGLGYIITALFIALITLSILSLEASAEKSGDYTYVVKNGTAEITDYSGNDAEVIIPAELDGYKVTSIGWNSFWVSQKMVSVTIPEGVTSIDDGAFSHCSSLTNITIPSTVTSIHETVFDDSPAFTTITVSENNPVYKSVNGVLFSKNGEKLIYYPMGISSSTYTIPEGVTTIGEYAFYMNLNLKEILFPESLTKIEYRAFDSCEGLTEITIPESIITLSSHLFYNCENLKSVTLPGNLKQIGEGAFEKCVSLTSISIPDTVYNISLKAFAGCKNLTAINVSENNKSYKSDNGVLFTKKVNNIVCYPQGKKETSYTIPEGVTIISPSAFYGCSNLTDIVVPDGVTKIGNYAFENCTGLTSIALPDGLTEMGNYTFLKCKKIKEIEIPNGITEIGAEVFEECTGLEKVVIPDSVETIKKSAFSRCYALNSINIPESVTKLSGYAFYQCKALTGITIPGSITEIGDDAFFECENLKDLIISEGVTDIGSYAFFGCKSIADIKLPNSLVNIGYCAFGNCSSVTSISIPERITELGINPFIGCTNLESVNVSDKNSTYMSVDGVLLSKTGKTLIYYPEGKSDEEYKAPDTITSIEDSAFYGNKKLKHLIFGNKLLSVGKGAFMRCSNLKSVTFPKSLMIIQCRVFEGCDSLTDIYYTGSANDWSGTSIVVEGNGVVNGVNVIFNSNTDVVAFVKRLYIIILNRSPETEGCMDWTERLTSGKATSAEIVYGIANSQEFANRGLSNEEIVETMYQAMLGRASDEGGKANWVNCLNSGMTVTGIINGFSGSQEFANICAEYNIQPGAITTCDSRDRNNGLTLFVSRMYTKALDRDYDVAGLNDWTNRYLTGEAKVSDIAFGFIFSPEFIGKNLSDSDYVDTLYRTFFNREPDEGGKADWMNKLANGMAREDVLNGFVGSQECINLVNSFGI